MMANSLILVVNDNADQGELLRAFLEESGYRVLIAFDGSQAVEIAMRERPDLVISDISMPVMNGIQLCRTLRADRVFVLVPILLVTAIYKDHETVIEALAAGADDYIEAPYDPYRLVGKVARLLERRKGEEVLKQREESFRTSPRNLCL